MSKIVEVNLSLKDLTGLENFDQISRAIMAELLKQMALPSHLFDDKPRSNLAAMALHPLTAYAANQSSGLERWRVKFQTSFDITNDEWEEILDWGTRSMLPTMNYLNWLYDGMIAGHSLSWMLAELE